MSLPLCVGSITQKVNAKYINASIFCIVIFGVWMLFAVPVIFYHLQQEVSDTTLHFALDFGFLQVDVNAGSNATKLQASGPANYSANSLNCSPHFTLNAQKGICSPICGEWEEFTQNQVVAFTVTTTLLAVLHVLGTIIALFFSCYNHKIM